MRSLTAVTAISVLPGRSRCEGGRDWGAAVLSIEAGFLLRRRQRLVRGIADHEFGGRRLDLQRARLWPRREQAVGGSEVGGGDGEREWHRQRHGADEVRH